MEKVKQKYNWRWRMGLSIFVLFVIHATNFLLNPYSSYWLQIMDFSPTELMLDFVFTFFFAWIIIEASILIAKYLEPIIPWTRTPLLRFFVQTMLIVVSTLVLILFQAKMLIVIFGDFNQTQQEFIETWQFFFVIVIVSLFVSAVHTGYYLLDRWKMSISEANDLKLNAMELKEIAMQSELQSLKIQLDPHFMFNNFSTLAELINEDTDTATLFLKNLSRVYRYMIQNLKKDIISLNEEVAFVKAYCYLIHIRHDDNVQIVFNLNDKALDLFIPPIALQLLVENAIKHNIATAEHPLVITIESINHNKDIKVTNNLQRMANTFPKTGLGLKNITDRYRILSNGRLPAIEETSDCFCVTLPLLEFNA